MWTLLHATLIHNSSCSNAELLSWSVMNAPENVNENNLE